LLRSVTRSPVGSEGDGTGPEVRLDDVDRALLFELRTEGRASYAHLARTVGLSQASVRVRVQRLLASKVVTIAGIVHPSILGVRTMAAGGVVVRGEAQRIVGEIAALPEASFVVIASGRFDVIFEVRCRSDEHLVQTLDSIRLIDGVRSVETLKYLHVAKPQMSTLGYGDGFELDGVDRVLLRELQAQGRATYAHLSSRVGLSEAAVRVRVMRLLNSGAVSVIGIIDPMALGIGEICGFTMTVHRSSRSVAADVARVPEVVFAAVTGGRWDVIGTLSAASDEQILDALDTIRAIDGVRTLESFPHVSLAKEQYPRLD
jgi:DNA-binding Lrp family transcriptional regulator